MAPRTSVTAPDYKNIPHSHCLPSSHRQVTRLFSKLSRQSLISLALQWLQKKNRDFCLPFLAGDADSEAEDYDAMYAPAGSHDELIEYYKALADRKGGRREVMDRILEGDWRNGISMFQLATAEIQHLLDHPSNLRWTAKRLARTPSIKYLEADMEVTDESEHLPRFQAQTFLANLAKELTPLMKAHYLLTKIKNPPITLLRVYVHDSPYSTEASLAVDSASVDGAKAVFFIFPHGTPHVWHSLATNLGQVVGDESRHLRDVVIQAIPKAFSKPSNRFQLVSTTFSARSLSALLNYRGPGKTNASGGGYSIFADTSFSQNAFDFITTRKPDGIEKAAPDHTNPLTVGNPAAGRAKRVLDDNETPEVKRRKDVAQGRFGSSARPDDGAGLERFEVRIDDPFPTTPSQAQHDGQSMDVDDIHQPSRQGRRGRRSLLDRSEAEQEEADEGDDWTPDVRLTFQGSHVFAGIRKLLEEGVIDGEKMPGWMTGEAGVTTGAIKNGRIRTKKGIPSV
ncbi:CHL4-domain-containing protein [Polyplosphaeria fusca]|uniref:CHL4-domain-containing protein n=1 Tax=Polyplosphaeria fusca TaxID=682080 RepID=A0A9P4R0Q2_9PLEO|nr:CHL4-domain-containing protein [Polyplosphaeria fusca]